MTADLFPLLARDRYTDEEWELAEAGACSWNWSVPVRRLEYCRKPADPTSFYRFCREHDQDIRDAYGSEYGR